VWSAPEQYDGPVEQLADPVVDLLQRGVDVERVAGHFASVGDLDLHKW